MFGWRPLLGGFLLLVAGCSDTHRSVEPTDDHDDRPGAIIGPADGEPGSATESAESDTAASESSSPTTPAAPAAEPPAEPSSLPEPVSGRVVSATTGQPLAGARVTFGEATVLTGDDGSFDITGTVGTGSSSDRTDASSAGSDDASTLVVERAAWQPAEVPIGSDRQPVTVELEPLVVRGIRVSREVAGNPVRWRELLDLADASSVNALVFDTKDEASDVLYETDVAFASELGAVDVVYDPERLIADAKERGLYTITRIVTFEDAVWAAGDPDAKLAGSWVDAGDPANWRYPIDLAVEACELGFDEIQFDYVRFPSGRTAEVAADLVPPTAELRAAAIADFLASARSALQENGCGISAAIFGIVMSSETDERLGQTPETVSPVVDAVSPMLYPSHYSSGWLGFADPNDHPGPVVAYSLDAGEGRVAADAAMRPWIQGFYYNGDQIKAQIEEAEARGAGWIIWNASGNYQEDWLPPSSPP